MNEKRSLQALGPLIRATAHNIARKGLPDAITGPLKRGDVGTIAAHLNRLAANPDADAVYRLLSRILLGKQPDVVNRKRILVKLGQSES